MVDIKTRRFISSILEAGSKGHLLLISNSCMIHNVDE